MSKDIYQSLSDYLDIKHSPIDFDVDDHYITGVAMPGQLNPMYGVNHTSESRALMSQKHKGKKISDETRQKMSETAKRKMKDGTHHFVKNNPASNNPHWLHTEEVRKKMATTKKGQPGNITRGMQGKTHSEETRRRMSEAAKRRWNKDESNTLSG